MMYFFICVPIFLGVIALLYKREVIHETDLAGYKKQLQLELDAKNKSSVVDLNVASKRKSLESWMHQKNYP